MTSPSALAYVHESGLVHGALSPSKLLLDGEGRVRVSDIALAGIGSAYRERLTLDDVRFLSPEQAIGDPASPKSDVYALALIIYEALTGVTPFDGVTPESVLRARINATLPMRPELGTLDMLLAQAAVSDPRLRLDAETFANRLGAVVSDDAPLVLAPVRGRSASLVAVPALGAEELGRISTAVSRPDHRRDTRRRAVGRAKRTTTRPPRRRVDDTARRARSALDEVSDQSSTTRIIRDYPAHADWLFSSRRCCCSSSPLAAASPGSSAPSPRAVRSRTSST